MATATETALSDILTLDDLLQQLGGIAAARVLFRPFPAPATEADLIQANDRKLTIYELVDGVLVEKAMGYTESNLALFLGGLLNAFVIPRNLGKVCGASTG